MSYATTTIDSFRVVEDESAGALAPTRPRQQSPRGFVRRVPCHRSVCACPASAAFGPHRGHRGREDTGMMGARQGGIGSGLRSAASGRRRFAPVDRETRSGAEAPVAMGVVAPMVRAWFAACSASPCALRSVATNSSLTEAIRLRLVVVAGWSAACTVIPVVLGGVSGSSAGRAGGRASIEPALVANCGPG